MELKKITIPALLAVLSLLFMAISLAVFLTHGKSARWVARKMKLGGIMLSLTAILQACDPSGMNSVIDDENPPYTCYMVAGPGDYTPTDLFFLDNISDSTVTVIMPQQNTIKGEIRKRTQTTYSFAVFNADGVKVQKEDIEATDKAFDEEVEPFQIIIKKEISKGQYILRFFVISAKNQPDWSNQFIKLNIR